MHSPRRGHALPRLSGVSACTTASPSTKTSTEPSCAGTQQRHSQLSCQHHVNAVKHDLEEESPFSTPLELPCRQNATAPAPQRPKISPRNLWRARAPRQIPAAAASLLPCVSSASSLAPTTSSRVQKLLSGPHSVPARSSSGATGAASSDNTGTHSQSDDDNEDDEGRHYDGEYDRLVFSSIHRSRTALPPLSSTADEDRANGSDSTVAPDSPLLRDSENRYSELFSTSNPRDPPSLGFITASQAAAALERLPEPPTSQLRQAVSSAVTAPISEGAAAVSAFSSPCQPCSSTGTALKADALAPQPDAWWSTLDGTLSPTNTLLDDESQRLHHVLKAPPPESLHPLSTPSLNDTLGRADRAAIVLSMRLSHHTSSAAEDVVTAGFGRDKDVDADAGGSSAVRNMKSEEATAAAVAALAARLSRATADGSVGGGLSGGASTRLSDASRGSAGHSTLQGLRDALRLTQPSAEELDIPAPHSASRWLTASQEGHAPLSSDVRGKPAQTRITHTSRAHRRAAEGATHSHGAQEGRAKAIKRDSGTQRDRGASMHIHVRDTDHAPAAPALALLSSAPFHRGAAGGHVGAVRHALHLAPSATDTGTQNSRMFSVSFTTDLNAGTREGAGSRMGDQDDCARTASHAFSSTPHLHASGGLVLSAESSWTFPWQKERLTLEAVERRYGAQSAVHTHRRNHLKQDNRRPGEVSAAGQSRRSSYAEALALLESSVVSSIPTSAFSVASLTSSIFMRELGESEAARQMFAKHRWRLAGSHEEVGSASGNAAQRSPLQGQHSTSTTQARLQYSTTSKEAAAKAYRDEQLRLYSSHLTTPSTLFTGSSSAEEEHLMDVESLFRDTTRSPVEASMNPVGCAAVSGTGVSMSTKRSGAGAAGVSASDGGATTRKATALKPATVTPPRLNALDRALRARAAILRRHVQEKSEVKRQLHKVRQWCDRTHVMIRFDNGVCVEQMTARPSHRALAREHHQNQQRTMGVESQTGSGGAQVGAATADANLDDVTGWQNFVYVDDPSTAHDALMTRVAEEEQEVQRQNFLQQCRKRRHVSLLVESSMGRPRSNPLASSEQYIVSGRAAAPAACGESFGHRSEKRRSVNSLASSTSDAERERLGIVSQLEGLGTKSALLQEQRFSSELTTWATDDTTAQTVGATFGHVPPSPTQQPLRAIHADLCARLETWGADIADDEEALTGGSRIAEETAARPPSTAGDAARDGWALSLTWQGEGRGSVPSCRRFTILSDESEKSVLGRRVSAVGSEARSSVQGMTEQSNVVAPPINGQRTSLSQSVPFSLKKAERDLLSFVLTCASSRGNAHLAVLHSLCQGGGRKSGSTEYPLSGTASAIGLAATPLPPALVALRTMLDQWSQAAICDAAAVDGVAAKEISSYEAAEAGVPQASVGELPFSVPCGLKGEPTTQETAGADGGFPGTHYESEGAVRPAGTTRSTTRVSVTAPTTEKAPPPSWNALITFLLSGYSAVDLSFLRQLHLLLWQYEGKERGGVHITAAGAPKGAAATTVPLPQPPISAGHRSEGAPPAVLPLALHLSIVQKEKSATSTCFRSSESGPPASSTVIVDAADLLNAITATSLFSWLCDASRQSPTTSWEEMVTRLPETCAQDWQNALARCIEVASSGAHPRSSVLARTSLLPSEQRRSRVSFYSELGVATAPSPYAGRLESFLCDTACALESAAWRLRWLHNVLQRASLLAEQDRSAADSAASAAGEAPVASLAGHDTSDAVSVALPCIGDTPYLPRDEARARYPLDMRNLYLVSALAVEDIDTRVVPQLREARAQYAEARKAATDAVTLASAPRNQAVSNVSQMTFSRPAASLPLALQQRVHLDRLCHIEQRFFSLLLTLWNSEQSVLAFNHHVTRFNAFTAAEQRCWGPLYRSSLKVAYFVCEELVEKGMENVSAELLPFVSIVAAFAGCGGGHRELLSKLKTVMLELTERAKKVQVPLESLSWQRKRSQVLEEAIQASKIAPRRAGAVVSCLTTEADVESLPLTELAMPALRLIHALPLFPPQHDL
ncbi:hypothetical protein, conserved [Leishmania tarentolae]|uniref:Uncharacterized protein n=1 Tax=Leishmania tarentolae TaxID=5689 RepID=A0A640KPS5_LEITA|nr:hypothetical protein, conserved [Leishmania tarentolae]